MIATKLQKILPGAMAFVDKFREATFAQISRKLTNPRRQPADTILSAFRRVSASTGTKPEIIEAAVKSLSNGHPVLSANHHGFETHPEMVQGTMIFGLSSLLKGLEKDGLTSPLVVLASSNVPLNNPTAPGGLLIGRRVAQGRRPQLRLFSRSMDHVLTSRAPVLTKKSITAALERLKNLPLWTESEKKMAFDFVENYLLSQYFLDSPNFLTQASKLAALVWRDRFDSPSNLMANIPPLIHIDLEALVASSLAFDMFDSLSPIAHVLFNQGIRSEVVKVLADRTGAWSGSLLGGINAKGKAEPSKGTVFFWGVDARGCRSPLSLETSGNRTFLSAISMKFPLEPEPIATALAEGHLIPGLFLDYLTLASHGLTTYGGVFMIDYLPLLLLPVAQILEIDLESFVPDLKNQKASDDSSLTSELIFKKEQWPNPLEPLLAAGMLPIGFEEPASPGGFAAAGALELFASKPFSLDNLRALAQMTVGDSWPFTAGEWYQEEIPPSLREPGWESLLSKPSMLVF
ncbi:MAG: hypothetical protein LBE31_05450 [Deltaproteobacteria bacterium]|nr:hypothetical protein [Deltaproteobacteria bacterium]